MAYVISAIRWYPYYRESSNKSATTQKFKTTMSGRASRRMGSEAKGVCEYQGWARRFRDLDVRGGAAEGTAP